MWWGALVTRTDYEVKEITLQFDNLPSQFDGYRMVQFSDLHVGSYAGDTTYVAELVDAINGLDADIIFLPEILSTGKQMKYCHSFQS